MSFYRRRPSHLPPSSPFLHHQRFRASVLAGQEARRVALADRQREQRQRLHEKLEDARLAAARENARAEHM